MHTPAEANTKDCTTVHTTVPTAFQIEVHKCEAYYCMHWRWSTWTKISSIMVSIFGLYPWPHIISKGYCGLSGKP